MGAVERVQPRVSFADLERAPEDGRRYELYDGEVYVVPAPILLHQVVQNALTEELRAICRQHGGFAVGSPIDVVFSEHDVLQPDVVYFRPARTHLLDLHSAIRHARGANARVPRVRLERQAATSTEWKSACRILPL